MIVLSQMSIRDCAEYVDLKTYHDVRLHRPSSKFIDIRRINIHVVTPTVIGNAAFIAIYHKNIDERKYGRKVFRLIQLMIKNFYK
jgi:hypothetical protein